jgi:solute carrier family 50 protein (sugar transporter)
LFGGNIVGLVVSIWFNLAASNLSFKQQIASLPDVINVVDIDDQYGNSSKTQPSSSDNNNNNTVSSSRNYNDIKQHTRLSSIEEDASKIFSSISTLGTGKERNMNKDTGANDANRPQKTEQEEDHQQQPLTTASPPPITELPVFYKPPVHDYRVMAMSSLWIVVFSIVGFGDSLPPATKQLLVGCVTNFCLVFFYGAPLSSIAIVLRTRNTATLHVPTMFTNTASSVFWGVYGLAVMDYFVMVPNLIGAVLGITQIVLYVLFPRVEMAIVPVITAAVPTGTVDENGVTEMEVVQLQIHNVATDDLVSGATPTDPNNINDPSNNPLAVEYAVPTDELGNPDHTITTLHKRNISMDGNTVTENPLVLQYADVINHNNYAIGGGGGGGGDVENPTSASPFPDPSPLLGHDLPSTPGIGRLHRRVPSRGNTMFDAGDSGPAAGIPTHAVASVHHKRVLSNTSDTSFLAGLFAGDTDLAHVTTTTATLHRRVFSGGTSGAQDQPKED